MYLSAGHSHAHSHEESGPEEAWDEIFLCKQCKHPLAHQKKVCTFSGGFSFKFENERKLNALAEKRALLLS